MKPPPPLAWTDSIAVHWSMRALRQLSRIKKRDDDMLLIPCPHCGQRDQSEFSHHGEAHITRPKNPENLTDEQWGDYIFFRKNPKGIHAELWMHQHGCRKFFNVLRDTVTDTIFASYKIGEKKPPLGKKTASSLQQKTAKK